MMMEIMMGEMVVELIVQLNQDGLYNYILLFNITIIKIYLLIIKKCTGGSPYTADTC